MICPKCNSEYRPGFTICADCHVPLVADFEEEAEDVDEAQDDAAPQWDPDLQRVRAPLTSQLLEKLIPALEARDIPYLLQSGTAFGHAGGRRDLPLWNAALYVAGRNMDSVLSLIYELSFPRKSDCPFCKNPIEDATDVIVCDHCRTALHLECWHEKEGCSVYGCHSELGHIE
jgi:RING finger family protein